MLEAKRLMVIFGTRPEAVKLCPLIRELKERGLSCYVCVTGQHRELLDGVLQLFDVTPDADLNIMQQGQSLFDITGAILSGLRPILIREAPHLVLIHGDTTTAFAAALACFYCQIPVAHVEAGLRTYNLSSPFPEEWNRRAASLLSAHHFAPTERAKDNLLREGIPAERIVVTGNTGIDALRYTVQKEYVHPDLDWAKGSRLILLTAHRRENRGSSMRAMFRAIRRILADYPDVKILYPVHPDPTVKRIAKEELGDHEQIRLIEPLGVLDFHNFLAQCFLVLTDSGGLQEEAPALDKPVLVMRNTTERPEGLEAGCMRLVGTGEGSVYRGIRELLENEALYTVMSQAPNPYGDGFAARHIADYLEQI